METNRFEKIKEIQKDTTDHLMVDTANVVNTNKKPSVENTAFISFGLDRNSFGKEIKEPYSVGMKPSSRAKADLIIEKLSMGSSFAGLVEELISKTYDTLESEGIVTESELIEKVKELKNKKIKKQ